MDSSGAATSPNVSLTTMQGLIWGGFTLCVISFICRAYIRILCYRRILVDDWLMLASLLMFLAIAVLSQLSLRFIYAEAAVTNGQQIPGPSYLNDVQGALRAFGVFFIVSYIGLWFIKLGFLVFFYRLGSNITKFMVLWWMVLLFTIGCLVVILGTGRYSCFFGTQEYLITVCSSTGASKDQAIFKLSVALDVISDALIIIFPISILWGTKITPRTKYVLSAIFSLVLLTMSVTIVRVSAYGGADETVVNIRWVWFWITVEWVVSFIIACIVSFRALFTQKKRISDYNRERTRAAPHIPKNTGFLARAKYIQNSFLETCRTLEDSEGHEMPLLASREPEESSVDISGNEIRTDTTRSVDDGAYSMRTLHRSHPEP